MIEQMNGLAESWWNWMWPMFWQVSVLVILVGAIDLMLRRRVWPQVRYALWLLVLMPSGSLLFLVPPSIAA